MRENTTNKTYHEEKHENLFIDRENCHLTKPSTEKPQNNEEL